MGPEIVADERTFLGKPLDVGADVVLLVDGIQDVRDAALHALGRDPVGALYSSCFSRGGLVSAMARSIEPVTRSA